MNIIRRLGRNLASVAEALYICLLLTVGGALGGVLLALVWVVTEVVDEWRYDL